MGKMVAKWRRMGGNGENGGKWGEMGENGELWETAIYTLREMHKKCVRLLGNGRKIGEEWDNLGQISHFSQSHFPSFSTASPAFPQVPLMNFASRTSRLEKWEFRDWPTFADFSATANACLHPCCYKWAAGLAGPCGSVV